MIEFFRDFEDLSRSTGGGGWGARNSRTTTCWSFCSFRCVSIPFRRNKSPPQTDGQTDRLARSGSGSVHVKYCSANEGRAINPVAVKAAPSRLYGLLMCPFYDFISGGPLILCLLLFIHPRDGRRTQISAKARGATLESKLSSKLQPTVTHKSGIRPVRQ